MIEKILAVYAKAQEKIANSHPERGESQCQMEERISIAVYAANEIKGIHYTWIPFVARFPQYF